MGVVYKLTPHISSFIVEQKQLLPKMSCQGLADKVFAAFGQRVSKSSVHELLKQSHVIVPRSRILKEKFQIPQEKKEQISKELAQLLLPVLPEIKPVPEASIIQEQTPVIQLPSMPEVIREKEEVLKADIFLKCALWDLSFKSVMGLKSFKDIDLLDNPLTSSHKMEWDYLSQEIAAIKIELEDNSILFIDSRFQDLYTQNPCLSGLAASIERTACETADYILNNIEPMVIQEVSSENVESIFYNLILGFENIPGKRLRRASLINAGNFEMAEFNAPVAFKRRFIAGISYNHQAFQWFTNQETKESLWESPIQDHEGRKISLKACKKDNLIIVTNLISESYDNIIEVYTHRYPSANKIQLSALQSQGNLPVANLGPWLKQRLKERSQSFFPKGFSLQALEEVLALPAIETQGAKFFQVKLEVSKSFAYLQELSQALQTINNLHIRNDQGKIVRIVMEAF